jgi:serine/threonine-protein kinase
VEVALEDVSRLQQQARWTEARVALGQAENQLVGGGTEDLRERVVQARHDLELVVRLDDIRLKRAILVEGQLAPATANREYTIAFREAGFQEVGGDAAIAASWVADSAVHGALVAALDDWATCAPKTSGAWLLEVARRADPDPQRNRLRDQAAWANGPALRRLTENLSVAEVSPQLLVVLGNRLMGLGENAEPLLRAAQERYPDDFWVNLALGIALNRVKKPAEAEGYCRAALALRPECNGVHMELGLALLKMGRLPEAIAEFRRTLALDPNNAKAHHNLGKAFLDLGRRPEAIDEYRKAIAGDPKLDGPHTQLGAALFETGRIDEAITEFRAALALNPKNFDAHNNLGIALHNTGRIDEAIAEHRQAVALDPKNAVAHDNLGTDLHDAGRIDEAIVEYRKALALDPKRAKTHSNLGRSLQTSGRSEEAIAELREAVVLDSKNVVSRNNLGIMFFIMRRFEDARAELEQVIALDPKNGVAHTILGLTLLQQGRFVEGRQSLRRALELLPAQNGLRQSATQELRRSEEMIALDEKLDTFLKGEARPADMTARLNLAVLCGLRAHPAASARFYVEAFTAQPKLADDLQAGHRYEAARAAALAAAGKDKGAVTPDDKERFRLRKQALAWLHADLAARTKQAEASTPPVRTTVRKILQDWQTDAALAGLRDDLALGNLPESERSACRKLWAEVAEVVKKYEK